MKQTYMGGCQCGAVRFEVSADIVEVFSCNCSRCGKLGALLAPAAKSDFKWLAGENEVTDFQFNRHVIHHPFCATCGIQSFAHGTGPGGKDMVMVNVRCLDNIDPEQFNVRKFDGRSL